MSPLCELFLPHFISYVTSKALFCQTLKPKMPPFFFFFFSFTDSLSKNVHPSFSRYVKKINSIRIVQSSIASLLIYFYTPPPPKKTQLIITATLETGRGLRPKCIPQLFLKPLLGTLLAILFLSLVTVSEVLTKTNSAPSLRS